MSAPSIATSTAAMPPKPIERRNTCGKNSRDASEIATVRPENATVRPAVAIVVRSAASVSLPDADLLAEPADDEQRVVDRQPEPEHRDDVDREDRDVGDRLSSRSIVNAPRIASPPTASGRLAAVSPPKMTTSSTSTIGIEIGSARAMSSLTWVVMSLAIASSPPIWTSSPAGASRSAGSRSS